MDAITKGQHAQPTATAKACKPLAPFCRTAPTPAPGDQFTARPAPSAKSKVEGIWKDEVVGTSQRSYLLKLPKDIPADFKLDEAALDPRDRHELATYPAMRPLFTKLDYLRKVDPQAKQAFDDLYASSRNGDIMLRTYGTVDNGSGLMAATGITSQSGPGNLNSLAIASTGGAYSHVSMVIKPIQGAPPSVVESIFEGGVKHSGPYTFLAALVDPVQLPRTAVSLIRPTDSRADANAAAAYAKQQVGQPYNFAMKPNSPKHPTQNGFYCSQVVYQAFDMNPAIAKPVFKITPTAAAGTRARLTNAIVQGLHGERALNGYFNNAHPKNKIGGLLLDVGHSWIEAGPAQMAASGIRSLAVIGSVATSAALDKIRDKPMSGPTYTYRGGEVPAYVTPGDLARNDGRKILTIMIDNQR